MNSDIVFPSLLIISGILVASIVIIFLMRSFNRIIKIFQLYPESRIVLNIALKLISWFIGIMVFLIFLRLALRIWDLEFTTKLIEDIVKMIPNYILAILIILSGSYASRMIKEKARGYNFEFKDKLLLIIDFIIYMTFIFTALLTIGINITVFMEFYKVTLWVIGAIVALTISMIIGIPLGINIYEKMKKE